MKIKRTNPNSLNKITKAMRKSGYVEVGVIEPKKHDDSELTTAYIASIHEFGAKINHPFGHTITIPERSFMRSTLIEEKRKIRSMSKLLLKNIVNGKTTSKIALGKIGLYTADKISRKIVAIRTPENKPSTIKRKESSNPLVDTGQLKNSITWSVEDGKLR